MPLSRLRLRLAGWFALCLLASLAVLDLSLLVSAEPRRPAPHPRSRVGGESARRGVPPGIRGIAGPRSARGRSKCCRGMAGGAGGRRRVRRRRTPRRAGRTGRAVGVRASDGSHGHHRRAAAGRRGRGPPGAVQLDGAPRFTALVVGSTERVTEDGEALAWWLALSAPLAAALSLVGGYLISRRALRPLGELERAVAAVGRLSLTAGCPVTEPADEVGGWRFNSTRSWRGSGSHRRRPGCSPPSRAPDPDAADARARRMRAQPRPAPVQRGLS